MDLHSTLDTIFGFVGACADVWIVVMRRQESKPPYDRRYWPYLVAMMLVTIAVAPTSIRLAGIWSLHLPSPSAIPESTGQNVWTPAMPVPKFAKYSKEENEKLNELPPILYDSLDSSEQVSKVIDTVTNEIYMARTQEALHLISKNCDKIIEALDKIRKVLYQDIYSDGFYKAEWDFILTDSNGNEAKNLQDRVAAFQGAINALASVPNAILIGGSILLVVNPATEDVKVANKQFKEWLSASERRLQERRGHL